MSSDSSQRRFTQTLATHGTNSQTGMSSSCGTSLHAARTLTYPRWEDFEYKSLDATNSRLHWLGDGRTLNEKTGSGNRAWHLEDVDVPPVLA
ncbi:hypothetical protein BC834DRAFT_52271 [Gloeopeniophorella convolvens]|nr:hypothetical protein BC834DRAFT_52271 [Gloeopeniophorella convolvens]